MRRRGARNVRRFLRDAAVALFVGAVLVVLAMVLNAPSEDVPPDTGALSGKETSAP